MKRKRGAEQAEVFCLQLENKALKWVKEHAAVFIADILFGIIIYFTMMSENLVNGVDGIWHTSHFVAGAWETSLGRGLLYFFDKLRSGVVSMPLIATLTLALMSVSTNLLLELYSIREKGIRLLISLFVMASPVTCITLSHCYMAVDYGLAFLFSVIAVKCIVSKHKTVGVLSGGAFIAASMGCYQAYFGITCLLLLMILIQKVIEINDRKVIVKFIIKSILTVILGGVFYMLLANALLLRYNVEISNYKGASEVSIGNIITSFPTSVVRCYKYFAEYFAKWNMYLTVPRKSFFLLIGLGFLVLFFAIRLFVNIWHKNKIYAICFLICTGLIPAACCAILLIVQGTGMILLMSMSLAISPALYLLICMESIPVEKKGRFFYKKISSLLLFLLLWVEVITVTNDQLALKEGMRATEKVADMIINELFLEGYLERDSVIAIVGRPSENNLFAKREAWKTANFYAKFGGMDWPGEHGGYRSWVGVLAECCGINLNLCTEEQYKSLLRTDELAEMPTFPTEGSIREIDGVIVVKVSDGY